MITLLKTASLTSSSSDLVWSL